MGGFNFSKLLQWKARTHPSPKNAVTPAPTPSTPSTPTISSNTELKYLELSAKAVSALEDLREIIMLKIKLYELDNEWKQIDFSQFFSHVTALQDAVRLPFHPSFIEAEAEDSIAEAFQSFIAVIECLKNVMHFNSPDDYVNIFHKLMTSVQRMHSSSKDIQRELKIASLELEILSTKLQCLYIKNHLSQLMDKKDKLTEFVLSVEQTEGMIPAEIKSNLEITDALLRLDEERLKDLELRVVQLENELSLLLQIQSSQ